MKKYSFLPGFLLLAAGCLHGVYLDRWGRIDIVLAAIGAAGLAVGAWLNRTEIREWFADPRGVFALNTGISFCALFVILVVVNMQVRSHAGTIDLTSAGRNTLTDGTRAFLSKVTSDVVLRQFGRAHDPQLDQLLSSFAETNSHVRLEFVDVDRNMREARALGITKPNGTVIVTTGEKAQEGKAATVRFRKVDRPNEPALVTAMLQVLSNKQATLCFVTGHGEHGLEDQSATGLSRLAALLQVSNFRAARLSLLEQDVPADCSAVIVAGPQQDLQPAELQRLATYLYTGGHLALLLDPTALPAVSQWINGWGIYKALGTVLDASGASQTVGAGPDAVVVTSYSGHPITSGFEMPTMFTGLAPIGVGKSVNGGEAQLLAETGPRSFVRTGEDVTNVEFDKSKDVRGPVGTIAAISTGIQAAVPRAERRSEQNRMVVVGDSDFVANSNLLLWANRDLFLRTISWLVGESDVTAVNVSERQNRRIAITQSTKAAMFAVNLILLPLVPLIAGIIVVVRSKR